MRPGQVFNQAVIFLLLSMLPWVSWLGPSWGQSVQYGWIAAGMIWGFGALMLTEHPHAT